MGDTAPMVGIVCGSRSDFPILEKAQALLIELGVPCELRVASAHRAPDLVARYAETATARGIRVITPNLGGLDSLLSIVQMPRGIPVATVGIGSAENAALLAVSILALADPALAARLAAYRVAQTDAILGDPSNAEPLG
jgi:phosphoribosylcarboxyaminoimidazole (NCAIR) mutase